MFVDFGTAPEVSFDIQNVSERHLCPVSQNLHRADGTVTFNFESLDAALDAAILDAAQIQCECSSKFISQ